MFYVESGDDGGKECIIKNPKSVSLFRQPKKTRMTGKKLTREMT